LTIINFIFGHSQTTIIQLIEQNTCIYNFIQRYNVAIESKAHDNGKLCVYFIESL